MQEQLSRLRHDLRSAFNNVQLCVAAFATETDPDERLQWMVYVQKAADKVIATVDQFQQLGEASTPADAPRGT